MPIVGHVLEGMDNIGDGGGGAPDPFVQLFSSGFGWMIDSVGFIKEPIDKLDGDAAAVQTAVDSMKETSEKLTYVAQGHQEDIPSLADWEGDAGESYRSSMKLLRAELVSLAQVVEGLGTLAAVSGSMVMTLRKIIRDLVAVALGTIVIIMLAAMAAAFCTFGASVPIGIASSVAVAGGVTIESLQRIDKLMDALGRQTERMGELESIAGDVADGLKRFEKSTKPHQSASGPNSSEGYSSDSSGGLQPPPLDFAQQPGAYPTDYAQQPGAYPTDY
ncbi:MAG: WXG100 family type VII secretion target, partial [Actinomycetes bacterium]